MAAAGTGIVLTAVFATVSVNPDGANGLLYGETKLLFANVVGGLVVALYSMGATYFIFKLVPMITPVRVTTLEEETGLDVTQHGENILILE